MRFIVAFAVLMALGFVALVTTEQLSHVGTPPDPNDPRQAGMLTPLVIKQNLKGASDALLERQLRGEITKAQFDEYMTHVANNLLDQVNIERIPSKSAWEYGEIYITARRWKDAKRALEMAVKAAKGEDRRVNDNLRLARVLAELGDVDAAIKTARSTFNTPDEGAAPILPATLLEIVPAAANKGRDAELGELLEDAIKCELRTIVDPTSQPGRDFITARRYHVEHAWARAVQLYLAAGREDLARQAAKRSADWQSSQTSA